ncbi:50S ribosomal protein L4 [Nodosilinea sp. P-1105]|uniref:50S ribosomal protein L4 n=1 Tax=Nodosilinea sp. P-1105 TaxID=2546229 RepID=UPI00146C4A95|nr:50S ribosomal protein L4 [Nodosilinea sp. P-1105]NMF82244.1 50S ribosomal protein L4 [Nodosilinea sp. P-1105]
MVECVVKNWEGQEASTASLDFKVADQDVASHIVHRALVRQMNNARQGTVSSKTRAEVRGGGRKPWRQKGTGRARAGSNRSPLWRGGGVIFGPKPRDFSVKMNRKERRLALRTAFQDRLDDLIVVEAFDDKFSRPKTKDLLEALTRWGVDASSKVLLIIAEKQELIYLSARNIENVKLITANNLNIYDLLAADQLVATAPAIEAIQEVYGD